MSATKAYIDTCIVSGLARLDIPKPEIAALQSILRARKAGKVELLVSPIVEREIAAIPEKYRTPHSTIFVLRDEISLFPAFRMTPPFSPLDYPHGVRPDRLLMLVGNILSEIDAAHVYQAAKSGIGYVITVDDRTMLRHSPEVENVCGVKLVWPSEFVKTVVGHS